MNKNYEVSIDIRWLCLIYFLILNLIILIMQKTTVTWVTMIWGIGMVAWFINFMMTLIKIFNRFFKNRKDKNVQNNRTI